MIDGNAIPQIARGIVWCTKCGRSERVRGNDTLNGRVAGGWPKCCGYTMTIDSPVERIALAEKVKVEMASRVTELEAALKAVHSCGHKKVECGICDAIVHRALRKVQAS